MKAGIAFRNRRLLWFAAGAIGLAAAAACAAALQIKDPGIEIVRGYSKHVVSGAEQFSAGLCPWRQPEADLKQFFSEATGYADETLIFSRLSRRIVPRLGRPLAGDENAMIVHRVKAASGSPGIIVTRRVCGEFGVIEMVLAVRNGGTVQGVRFQRSREPEATAKVLQSDAWRNAFRGKTAASAWELGRGIPAVPAEARASADAILRDTRTILTLLDVATTANPAIRMTPPAPVPPASTRAGL